MENSRERRKGRPPRAGKSLVYGLVGLAGAVMSSGCANSNDALLVSLLTGGAAVNSNSVDRAARWGLISDVSRTNAQVLGSKEAAREGKTVVNVGQGYNTNDRNPSMKVFACNEFECPTNPYSDPIGLRDESPAIFTDKEKIHLTARVNHNPGNNLFMSVRNEKGEVVYDDVRVVGGVSSSIKVIEYNPGELSPGDYTARWMTHWYGGETEKEIKFRIIEEDKLARR